MNGMDGMDKDSSIMATPWSSKLVRAHEKGGWCIGGAVKEMKKTNNNKDVFSRLNAQRSILYLSSG